MVVLVLSIGNIEMKINVPILFVKCQ